MVEIAGRNAYRVTFDTPGQDDDGVALVHLVWDRGDDEVVLRCAYHRCHLGINSDKTPPCHCIADVIVYRRSAGISSTGNQG